MICTPRYRRRAPLGADDVYPSVQMISTPRLRWSHEKEQGKSSCIYIADWNRGWCPAGVFNTLFITSEKEWPLKFPWEQITAYLYSPFCKDPSKWKNKNENLR